MQSGLFNVAKGKKQSFNYSMGGRIKLILIIISCIIIFIMFSALAREVGRDSINTSSTDLEVIQTQPTAFVENICTLDTVDCKYEQRYINTSTLVCTRRS